MVPPERREKMNRTAAGENGFMAEMRIPGMRWWMIFAALLGAAVLGHSQEKDSFPPGYSTGITGGIHDFDFYIGAWTVHSRGLKARNVGSSDWKEFTSEICVTPYLEGGANVSEMYSPASGNSGLTLRTFDVGKQQWAVHYISHKTGELDAGMFGGFAGSQGKFFGADTDNGQPIKARILWTRVDQDHVRWEQAFSYDNRTWETNWISEMSRADPAASCDHGHPKH
jgi:hypothetical protein